MSERAAKAIDYAVGKYLDYTPSAAVTAGTPTQIGGLVGVPVGDVAISTAGSFQVEGIMEIACTSATGSAGDDVYWDADGSPVGGTASSGALTTSITAGDFWVGTLVKAHAATDRYALVNINKNNPNVNKLVYAMPDVGTVKTSWTTRAALGLASCTFPANTLKEGDVIHVHGLVNVVSSNSTDTLVLDVGFGLAGVNALAASDATNITNADIWAVDLYITIRSATTAMVTGLYCKTIAALATATVLPYQLAEITIATTGIITVGIYGTCSVSNANNQIRAENFIVEWFRK